MNALMDFDTNFYVTRVAFCKYCCIPKKQSAFVCFFSRHDCLEAWCLALKWLWKGNSGYRPFNVLNMLCLAHVILFFFDPDFGPSGFHWVESCWGEGHSARVMNHTPGPGDDNCFFPDLDHTRSFSLGLDRVLLEGLL